MRRHLRFLLATVIFCAVLAASVPSSSRATDGCYEVQIEYLGRTLVYQDIDGNNFYLWRYRVTGAACINRGLSHWIFNLCPEDLKHLTQPSVVSVDQSDPDGGDSTFYVPSSGFDPTTGTYGIKWDMSGGNELDKPGEYDEFSFIAPGTENYVQVGWGSKGSTLLEFGATIGPSCEPLPVQSSTWSAIKSRHI